MDEILAKAGSQAVTFAIKSGISLASSYAIKTVANFLTKIPKDDAARLEGLRKKLETRIEIVSPAIDLIKLVAAKGNTNLGSTLRLTKDLKEEIDSFDNRIAEITKNYGAKTQRASIDAVENYILDLLSRIEEVIPLINLSLTTSGASLSTALPQHVSPGSLLHASDYIGKNNTQFNGKDDRQVGPTFELTLFSIFYHLVTPDGQEDSRTRITWKEDIKKAIVTLWRRHNSKQDYDYYLKIRESFDDGRYHDLKEETPKVINVDIYQIIRLFFSASGKLLKLEERNSPVLVLKVDSNLRSSFKEDHATSTEDIEWFALGEYVPDGGSDSSDEDENEDRDEDDEGDDSFESADEGETPYSESKETNDSLALLEYLLRLTSLQCNDQMSILQVHDERLSLYLNDENPNSIKAKRYNIDDVTDRLKKVDLNKQ